MIPPEKKPAKSRIVLWTGIVWCLAVMLTCFFDRELEAVFWILLAFWWIVLAALGFALIVRVIIRLQDERGRATPALAPIVAALAFWGFWNFGGGAAWGNQARFEMQRPGYEAALARIQRGELPLSGTIHGQSYQSDATDRRRVSFIEKGGILDNYTAIVYDPTDAVMRANQFKGDFSNFDDPNLRAVKKLFGGDMVWATPLGKHWYRCGFT